MVNQNKQAASAIKRHRCEFVTASDLFAGYRKLWNEFVESAPPFSWGDNNRTLITIEALLDNFDNKDYEHFTEKFRQRCLDIGAQSYVDLEN